MFGIFVRRPVLTISMYTLLMVSGLLMLKKIDIAEEPAVHDTSFREHIRIQVPLSSEKMENSVINVIEDEVKSIPGITGIHSVSQPGLGSLTLTFNNIQPSDAKAALLGAISNAKVFLPSNARVHLNSNNPHGQAVVKIVLSSTNISKEEVYNFLHKQILHELETIDGVSEVKILGSNAQNILIHINSDLMSMHKVTAQQIHTAMEGIKFKSSAHSLVMGDKEVSVEILFDDSDQEADKRLLQMKILNQDGKNIALSELVSKIEKTNNKSECTKYNNQEVIVVEFSRKENANILNVCFNIKERLNQLKFALTKNQITYNVIEDKSTFILDGIHKVKESILEAIILTSIIVVVFQYTGRINFNTFKISIIPILAIPFSLVPTLIMMYILKCTINVYTLFAAVLAIGLVVDDAIVVLEHIITCITKKINSGTVTIENIDFIYEIEQALNTIVLPIVSTTLTLAIVYIPIVILRDNDFMQLFYEFAVVLAGSVIFSGIVSLTLTPLLIYKLVDIKYLFENSTQNHKSYFNALEDKYESALSLAFKHSYKFLITLLIIITYIGVLSFVRIQKETNVYLDKSEIVFVPNGGLYKEYNTKYREECFSTFIDKVMAHEIGCDVNNTAFTISNSNANMIFFTLKKINERKFTRKEIVTAMNEIAHNHPYDFTLREEKMAEEKLLGGILRIFGGTSEELIRNVNKIATYFYKVNNEIHCITDEISSKDVINLIIDLDICSFLSVSPFKVAEAISFFQKDTFIHEISDKLGTYKIFFIPSNTMYNEPDEATNSTLETILNTPVPSQIKDTLLSASTFAKQEEGKSVTSIVHCNGTRGVKFYIQGPLNFNEFSKHIEILNTTILDNNSLVTIDEEVLRKENMLKEVKYTFFVSLFLIFIILSIQFNSFKTPFIILAFTVPLASVGALFTLLVFKQSLNLASIIGIITLIGLISKHGILIIEQCNENLEHINDIKEATLQASKIRMKPIVMTTICMILGAVPLVIKTCEFQEYRIPIGLTIIGGMLLGTILTLFMVPTAYVILNSKNKNKNKKSNDSDAKLDL